ncbi:MAG: c-type cytochrome [Dehalococcoidia bacterium]|nr:c-type cytochrome [Dehalococcoidia bacterium]
MRRRSVPPGPILGAIMMSGLAFTLIAVIIARSPYTHGNLRPEGYDRTEIIYLGEEHPFTGIGLADPSLASTGDPVQDGRVLFFGYGCASCHGLQGKGGAVGKNLSSANSEEISDNVRQGPKTMPAFETGNLSDGDLEKLIAFLKSARE